MKLLSDWHCGKKNSFNIFVIRSTNLLEENFWITRRGGRMKFDGMDLEEKLVSTKLARTKPQFSKYLYNRKKGCGSKIHPAPLLITRHIYCLKKSS